MGNPFDTGPPKRKERHICLSLIHILQYLDLQNLDVPGQVEKLRLEAKLTAEQAAAVDGPALRRFLEAPLAEEMRQAETAAREYRFTVLMPARDYDPAAAEEDSILLQGVVDCWFETPEGITVVDFKTDFVQTEEDVAQHLSLIHIYRPMAGVHP